MKWSIILAARNGADTLPSALAALARVERPAGDLEIVLVDNASTDGTGEILREFAESHGALCLEEPRRGKSWALNAALERATGEMLVFMDDDVMPAPGWLRAFEAASERFPNAAVLAGQVRPSWLAAPPQWLEYLASIGLACGCTDPRYRAGPCPAHQVKGANVAVRKSALEQHCFDTGTVNFEAGAGATGGEDTRFALALEREGKAIVHVAEALVSHIVGPKEMSLQYVMSRFMRIGRGNAAISGHGPLAFVLPAAKVAAFGIAALVILAFGRRNTAALFMARTAMNMGRLDYHRRGFRS